MLGTIPTAGEAMHKVVFDTDVFSEILKGTSDPIRRRARFYHAAIGYYTISSITVMEIVYGWRKDANDRALTLFHDILRGTEVLELDREAAWLAGQINHDLEQAGTKIGCEDPLIAAVAITRKLPLVTRNVRHFQCVREAGHFLEIETWL